MKRIIYSILQYRHSLLRNETFNIGIAFYFPEMDNKIIFYPSPNRHLLQNIYPDIDLNTLEKYLVYIQLNIENNKIEPHPALSLDANMKLYLKRFVLLEDSTVLQFANPVVISNVDESEPIEIIKNFIKILLSFQDNGESSQLENILYDANILTHPR